MSIKLRPSIGMALCASAMLTATVGCSSSGAAENEASQPAETSAPNILMVLADDLGYSDLGAYGGDASTPNIDALAGEGVQFANFHSYPICAPTRAGLMTGQDPHMVGLGTMEGGGPPGVPRTTLGYKGSLEGEYTGIAQILSDADYDTYQVGKWHLGTAPDQSPAALGFDQNYTLLEGGASHFGDQLRLAPGREEPISTASYEANGEPIDLPEDFYSTHNFTDEMLKMIESGEGDDKPFFGYLAYTAPHDPLHVPDNTLVDKYLDMYLNDNNYNDLRTDRIARMAEIGLLDDADIDTRWPSQTPEWDTLTDDQKQDLAYRLAVYSAMVEDVDTQLGRIIDQLKESGEYDNTMIVVASDNGSAGLSRSLYAQAPGALEWMDANYPLIGDVEAYGEPGSFPVLGLPNAQVASGPYFHTKGAVYDGGTRAPLIVKTPASAEQDGARIVDTFTQITDLYPTFADYAGATLVNPDALLGDSAKPLLDGTSEEVGDNKFGLEMFGERAFRDGDSKLVFAAPGNSGTGQWALYDLAADPGETTDLSAENPEEVQRLSALWDEYAAKNNVIPVDFEAVNAANGGRAPVIYSLDWAE